MTGLSPLHPTSRPSGQLPEDDTVFGQVLRQEEKDQARYAALYYASLGLPVFPVKIVVDAKGKEQKTPCIKDWPNQASTDSVVVSRWWTELAPGAMIGIVTGYRSGWGVIDVDCKNGAKGFDSLYSLADELAPLNSSARGIAFGDITPQDRLKPSGLVRTRSGGLHLWYRLGERSKARGRMKIRGLPGIEFKASGNYVVSPPSAGYEWLRHLPAEREVGVASAEYLAIAPVISETLLERLLDGGDDGSDWMADGDENKIVTRGRGAELLRDAVATLMTTPEGDGNNTVYRLSCDLYPYVALGELTKQEVDRAVWAGISRWGADENTIQGTMASAWKRTGERTLKFNDETWPAATSGRVSKPEPQPLSDLARLQKTVKASSVEPESVPDSDEDLGLASVVPIRPPSVSAGTSDTNDDDDSVNSKPEDVEEPVAAEVEQSPFETFVFERLPDHLQEVPGIMTEITTLVNSEYKRNIAKQMYQELTSSVKAWSEVDLGEDDGDPVPDVLCMMNGAGLLYSGEMNMTWGLASAGKSWLAYLAIMQQVKQGRHAILLDYENGRRRIRSRLRALGLTMDEVAEYVHVYLGETGMVPVKRMPVALDQVGIVVTDSCTGALAAMDLDAKNTGDIESFATRNITPFSEAGAAVLILDHVTHDTDKHDRPINSVHKLNRVQGAGYQVENVVPFLPGSMGWSWIRLWKDNSGGVDQVRGENVGRLVIDGTNAEAVRVFIDTDTTSLAVMSQANNVSDERVVKLIETLDDAGVDRGLGVNQTRQAMAARGISAGQDVVRLAAAARKNVI